MTLPQAPRSIELQEHAKTRIPGMTQLLSKRPDQFSLGIWPGYFSKAKGALVWDLDGNKYLDMSIGGIGATVLGYADDEVDEAVVRAIRDGVASSLNSPEEMELADLLCEIHPWAEQVRFARTGGESMAVGVRIARAATGRDIIAFCGYHGWHDWYLSANLGDTDALDGHLLPGLEPAGVPRALRGTAIPFHYNRIEELEEIVRVRGDELAAIVMEPIRNNPPEDDFLNQVRKLADTCGAALIFDEISAAFRQQSSGAHMTLGTEPDIAVFSKAIGNGYAIGAVIGRRKVMSAAGRSFISSTCWTERVGYAAALATIRKHRRDRVGVHLDELGRAVQDIWRREAGQSGLEIKVGGMPPLSHFHFGGTDPLSLKALFVQEMLAKGILASTIFYAMDAHSEADLERYAAAARRAFSVVADAVAGGNVAARLQGQPAAKGFARLT